MSRTEAESVPRVAPASATQAARAVELIAEMSPDLRGCAVLGAEGQVLASTGGEGWAQAAAGLLAAADAARGAPAAQVHVATEDGEAFAVRESGLAMVAVTERFALASLVLFDLRRLLGDLAGGSVPDRRAPAPAPGGTA